MSHEFSGYVSIRAFALDGGRPTIIKLEADAKVVGVECFIAEREPTTGISLETVYIYVYGGFSAPLSKPAHRTFVARPTDTGEQFEIPQGQSYVHVGMAKSTLYLNGPKAIHVFEIIQG